MRVSQRKVNYLIGIEQASWQPERKTHAIYGGDFWIWSNRWGQCLGGRHPWILKAPRKVKETMFTVVETLYCSSQKPGPYPDGGEGCLEIGGLVEQEVPDIERWERSLVMVAEETKVQPIRADCDDDDTTTEPSGQTAWGSQVPGSVGEDSISGPQAGPGPKLFEVEMPEGNVIGLMDG